MSKKYAVHDAKSWKEGNYCPICNTKLFLYERLDHRSEDAKRKWPMTKEEKTILACRCLHPGDFIIGGFF